MDRRRTAVRAALAAAAGLAVGLPCVAQDAPARPARTVTTAPPSSAGAREDAARTMPTMEAFGSGPTMSSSESVERLDRDFAPTAEIGTRRVGAVPIWPRGDLKFGNVRIYPFLREAVEYVSNFYRTHRTGDGGDQNANDAAWTHVNQLGLTADSALAGGRLRFAGKMNAEWNVRYDDGNPGRGLQPNGNPVDPRKDDTFEFDGELGGSYRFPSGVYIRGGVGYERRSDPLDAAITKSFKRTNRRSYLTAGMDKDIFFGSKFRFEMGMSVRDTIGREEGLDHLDRTETTYYVKATYPFWKNTTRIFGRARYRQDERESDQINDGNVWGFDAGIEGNIPLAEGNHRGLRGSVSLGFDHALYENETFTVGSTTAYRDENRENTNLSAAVTLQYMNVGRDHYDLRYLRTNQFSFHGNYQIVDRFDLGYTRLLSRQTTARIATFFEYLDPSGRLRPQEVGRRDLSGDYPNTTRFGLGGGIRHRLNDWADLDFQYDWERRNNPISGNVNHRASAGVTFYLNGLKPASRGNEVAASMEIAPAPSAVRTQPAAPAAKPPVVTAPPAPAAKAPPPPVKPATPAAPVVKTPPVPAAPPAPVVKPPQAPAAPIATATVTSRGKVVTEGASDGRPGSVIRLLDASSSARIAFADGASVDVVGPAAIRIVQVSPEGNRVQLIAGTVTEARVREVALEIQTPADASLVLQNAQATARVDAKTGVSFRRLGGDFARVYSGGGSSELGSSAWTLPVRK